MSMKCNAGQLTAAASVQRFQEWVYHIDHPAEALITPNYWLGAHDRLIKGDVITAYCAGRESVRRIEFVVARSDREKVIVAPFDKVETTDDGFEIRSAPLRNEMPAPKPVPQPDNPSEARFLELKHMGRGRYVVLNAAAEHVLEGIVGREFAVDLFDRITSGGLSLPAAQAENDAKGKKAA